MGSTQLFFLLYRFSWVWVPFGTPSSKLTITQLNPSIMDTFRNWNQATFCCNIEVLVTPVETKNFVLIVLWSIFYCFLKLEGLLGESSTVSTEIYKISNRMLSKKLAVTSKSLN